MYALLDPLIQLVTLPLRQKPKLIAVNEQALFVRQLINLIHIHGRVSFLRFPYSS